MITNTTPDAVQKIGSGMALVYKTSAAAFAFRDAFRKDHVVVKVGRKFCVVAADVAKRLKLKGLKNANKTQS